jgi:tRNA(Ile)-lysidine synthase
LFHVLHHKETSIYTHKQTLTSAEFESIIASNLDAPAGSVCLAAVSGGADSTAMLAALAASCYAQGEGGFQLRCLHVEHGIRPAAESRGDAAFVRELCARLKVPCKVVSIAPGKIARIAKRRGFGLEAAARLYRHRALGREALDIEAETGAPVRILIAHTRDDLLETALMRVLRGSGPPGLAAMPGRRGRILRPLIGFDRAGILAYLKEKNIPFRTDSSNADERYLRGRIRGRLIPLLNEFFPGWKRGLASLAGTQALAAAFLADEARRRIHWEPAGTDGLCAGAEVFFAQPPIIREEALFLAIDRLLAGGDSTDSAVRRAATRPFCAGEIAAADLGKLRLSQNESLVVLAKRKKRGFEKGFSLLIKEPGFYKLNGVCINVGAACVEAPKGASPAGFYAFLPLLVRRTLKSDRIERESRRFSPPEKALWSAIDRRGVAAFIREDCAGSSGALARSREGGGEGLYFISVN